MSWSWFNIGLIGADIYGQDLVQQQVLWKVSPQYSIKLQESDLEYATSWDLLLGPEAADEVHALFPLKLCCIQALSSDTIVFEKFNVRVPLDHLIPDILMTELPEDLTVDPSQFEFNPHDPAKLLGIGSAGENRFVNGVGYIP